MSGQKTERSSVGPQAEVVQGAWQVPPECGGQIVERAYLLDDGMIYRRTTDRSDGSVSYERREVRSDDDPINSEPR